MYCKTITKEIFDSYIANDSDTVLEGVVTNTFGNTTFWRFVRVPLAKGEHYVEALYAQSSFSFPLAMGVNHFSIKNGLEFMAFIVDHKETYCKSVEFALLFDDYRQADSNWVTAEMREKFLAYIEACYNDIRADDIFWFRQTMLRMIVYNAKHEPSTKHEDIAIIGRILFGRY